MLNLSHKLQEGGHHAEGNQTAAQTIGTPYEGRHIAQSEGAAQGKAAGHQESGTADVIGVLLLLQLSHMILYPLFALQRAQQCIMLHALLDLHENMALVLTDGEGEGPQPVGDKLAEGDGEGGEEHECPGQSGVEPVHEQEGSCQLHRHDHHLGQGDGNGLAHGIDILGHARGDVA